MTLLPWLIIRFPKTTIFLISVSRKVRFMADITPDQEAQLTTLTQAVGAAMSATAVAEAAQPALTQAAADAQTVLTNTQNAAAAGLQNIATLQAAEPIAIQAVIDYATQMLAAVNTAS